jgi:hypothetical protein
MLRRLWRHVAVAMMPCCGGYSRFFTDNNTTPTKVVLSCFGLLVGLWQYEVVQHYNWAKQSVCTRQDKLHVYTDWITIQLYKLCM